MKVTICPICRLTPELTAKEVKCPKCGRVAYGNDLMETLDKWNRGIVNEKPVKEEKKVEIETIPNEPETVPDEPEIEVKEEKPKKAPIKRVKKGDK